MRLLSYRIQGRCSDPFHQSLLAKGGCSIEVGCTWTYLDVRRTYYLNVRRHTSTYHDVLRRTASYVDVRRRASTQFDVRRHASTYVDVRRRSSTYVDVHSPLFSTHPLPSSEPTWNALLSLCTTAQASMPLKFIYPRARYRSNRRRAQRSRKVLEEVFEEDRRKTGFRASFGRHGTSGKLRATRCQNSSVLRRLANPKTCTKTKHNTIF